MFVVALRTIILDGGRFMLFKQMFGLFLVFCLLKKEFRFSYITMLSTCLLRIFKNCDVSSSLRTSSVFAVYSDSCVHSLNTQRPLKSPQNVSSACVHRPGRKGRKRSFTCAAAVKLALYACGFDWVD